MWRFFGHLVVVALALWLTSLVLPGMHLGDEATTLGRRVGTVLGIAVIFALVNSLVRPLLAVLTSVITCLTLGLFTLVINTAMLLLTAWVSRLVGLPFTFDSVWWALLASLVVGVLTSVFGALAQTDRSRRDS